MRNPSYLLLLFTLLLTSSSLAQILDDLEFGTPESLDIATWNIEWFPKNGTATIDRVKAIVQNLEIDLWAIQEIDDTTVFKGMIEDLDSYDYILMDGWFGGLVYVYNSSEIEVLDAFEIYTASPFWSPLPRSPLILHFSFNGEQFYAINNHFKCCGNGTIDWSDDGDEEMRRREACVLINDYIQNELPDDRVIVLGDLNDLIQEGPANNVFEPFLELPEDYLFVDMPIAQGPSSGWSFPGWPSHLDHLLISDELFTDFNASSTEVACLDIAAHMEGGWSEFDYNVSDHRPVAIKLMVTPLAVSPEYLPAEQSTLLQITDLTGRTCNYAPNKVLLYYFHDGSVRKHISWSQNAPY